MNKGASKTLTDRQAAEIQALAALPEDRIDTSDIPEILDWSDAQRGVNRVLRHHAVQAPKRA